MAWNESNCSDRTTDGEDCCDTLASVEMLEATIYAQDVSTAGYSEVVVLVAAEEESTESGDEAIARVRVEAESIAGAGATA